MHSICPDLEKYKEGWIKGFTFEEVKFIALLMISIVLIIGWCNLFAGIPIFIAVFIATWMALPIALFGFCRINDMSFMEILKRYIDLQDNTYYFVSDEGMSYMEVENKKGRKKNRENTGRRKENYNTVKEQSR